MTVKNLFCSRCNALVDFGARGDGPAIQVPMKVDEEPIRPLAQDAVGSYIFCGIECCRACGFDPYNDDIRPGNNWDGSKEDSTSNEPEVI